MTVLVFEFLDWCGRTLEEGMRTMCSFKEAHDALCVCVCVCVCV